MTTVMKHGVDASRVEHARLFRRDPAVQWDYRVHEQILPAAQRCGWPVRRTEIFIHHEGYVDPSGLQAKLARNLRLLNLEYAERPQDPLVLFNLGSMQLELGHPEAAIELLTASVHFAPRGYSLYAKSHAFLIVAYRQLGRAAEALQVCRSARSRMPREPELLFYEGLLLQESGDPAAAERCFRELLQLPTPSAMSGHDQGLQGYKARHNIAVSLREQGRWSEAELEWRAVLAEQPDFAPGWLALTQLLASQGRWEDLDREAMQAESQPRSREMGELMRVKLLLLRGQTANAARMLEELKQHRPHAVWPRLLLAEARWQLADDPKAIEASLRDVLTLDPNHLPTRTRLIELASMAEQPSRRAHE
jgi:tetratricopeptide (TPR) repeat protein